MPKRATPRFTRKKVFTIIQAAVHDWLDRTDHGNHLTRQVTTYLDAQVEVTIDRLINVWALGNGIRAGSMRHETTIEKYCKQRSEEIVKKWIEEHSKDIFVVPEDVQKRVLSEVATWVENDIVSEVRKVSKDYAAQKAKELYSLAMPEVEKLFDAEEEADGS